MNSGFERRQFSTYRADCKRASRHMLNSCKQAEQNGVNPEALASACLEVAAELMTRTGGRQLALDSLQMAMERLAAAEGHIPPEHEQEFRLN